MKMIHYRHWRCVPTSIKQNVAIMLASHMSRHFCKKMSHDMTMYSYRRTVITIRENEGMVITDTIGNKIVFFSAKCCHYHQLNTFW